ncbi:uncharacterized protein LOC142985516 [Anticarsia gemmatalis]|uniref:uncharacterized protein LOC142985516 n=1 Tax=Anticarsia gemmatalis TaxID=129554 RepID=UPI003F771CBF
MLGQMVYMLPVLLPTLVIRTYCDNTTSSDVVFHFAGHAEARSDEVRTVRSNVTEGTTEKVTQTEATVIFVTDTPRPKRRSTTTTEYYEDDTESVVFVPNEAPIVRIEDEYDRHPVRLNDLMEKQTIGEVVDGGMRLETVAPPADILFIAAKNNDFQTETTTRKSRRNFDAHDEAYNPSPKPRPPKKLDCTNLDCNNTIKSVCGGKIVNRKWQYRLFLNDCFFRKVNCNFKYEMSRYIQVPSDRCRTIASHYGKPFAYKPKLFDLPKKTKEIGTRKSFSSRRSMSMNMNGEFCSHVCPVSCPEEYEPECAVSATGQRRVFMNHCEMDNNSCSFSVVWHKRPLAECVGGKKADMRQNRFFISWMQRVGILDNKGKLVLE